MSHDAKFDVHPDEHAINQESEYHVRKAKVEALKKNNIQAWPENTVINDTCHAVIAEHHEHGPKKQYVVAGRLMSKREHGKSIFVHIQDRTGRLQLYLKQDILGEALFHRFKDYCDIGDSVVAKGTSFKTKTGEVSLEVVEITLVAKSLHPLPEKFHGITDVEMRYRQRYLDLMTNAETRERFIKRSAIVAYIRSFLNAHDFLEVETPMLHPIPGGAAARPFITHHNALDAELYLRIAPELYLKRLVIGGFERVYEINRNFRNEGVSTRHNPEFTMLEFYIAYKDYHYSMDLVEELLRGTAKIALGNHTIIFGNHEIDFGVPFKRLSMKQAIVEYSSITDEDLNPGRIDAVCLRHGLTPKGATYGEKLAELFEHTAEKELIQPTFIIQFPLELSPLAKEDAHNPGYAARFELYIAGMEISNSYNELNDPFDQAERFKEQARSHDTGNLEAHRYDADYITALEYGLPPTVGVGIGIDRLVMLLTNTTSIKDVILFPTLKRKHE